MKKGDRVKIKHSFRELNGELGTITRVFSENGVYDFMVKLDNLEAARGYGSNPNNRFVPFYRDELEVVK